MTQALPVDFGEDFETPDERNNRLAIRRKVLGFAPGRRVG